MSETGSELRNNNEKIVKFMILLKQQRDEMSFLIQKQKEEKNRIQTEIEKLTFKLSLLTKSLNQRIQAKDNYDKTIKEIEDNYNSLVKESGKLLSALTSEFQQLEEMMDKKTNTEQSEEKPQEPEPEPEPQPQPEPEDYSEELIASQENYSNSTNESSKGQNLQTDDLTSQSPESHRSSNNSENYKKQNYLNTDETSLASELKNIELPTKRKIPEIPDPSPQNSSLNSSIENRIKNWSIDYKKKSNKGSISDRNDYAENLSNLLKSTNKKKDDENWDLESYREAYDKQHRPQQSPKTSVASSASYNAHRKVTQ